MSGMLPAMILLFVAVLGHAAIVVGLYNVVNATGLPRTRIKWIEKGILLIGLAIPLALIVFEVRTGDTTLVQLMSFENWNWPTIAYLLVCAMVALVGAPFWIESRPVFTIARDRFEVVEQKTWKPESSVQNWIQGASFARMNRLPGNQISWTEANRKRLYFDNLPHALNGFKIAHLSDVHLTGQMSHAFYARAFDWIMSAEPDLVVLSGDIVDYQHALADLPVVFQSVHAKYGCYFVLGNHDRRLPNPMVVCAQLEELGWHDLGRSSLVIEALGVGLLGNELPWFHRNQNSPDLGTQADLWTLGVSHSPDQLPWGASIGCDLLLCGHTHGGQIRFPVIGPVVAPSWYGSRYASGIFQKGKTLMHVSRGLSGVHPFRWGCPPEVSILELRHVA